MKKTEHCSAPNVKVETACDIAKGIQTVQPFPTSGLLAKNSNLELAELERHIGSIRDTALRKLKKKMPSESPYAVTIQHESCRVKIER